MGVMLCRDRMKLFTILTKSIPFLSSIAPETGQMMYLPCKKCGYEKPRRINYAHNLGYRCSCAKCGYATKLKQTYEEALAKMEAVK